MLLEVLTEKKLKIILKPETWELEKPVNLEISKNLLPTLLISVECVKKNQITIFAGVCRK